MYNILIADDEKVERDVVLFLLDKYGIGFNVLQAANGRDAVVALADTPVDILLTDIKMPFLDGIELALKAKKSNPNIEIIFFSGYSDFEYVKSALSLHAVNYILKPINPEEFRKSIFDILDTINARETISVEKYIKERFFTKDRLSNIGHSAYDNVVFNDQDNLLLENIEYAVRANDPDALKQNVRLLLDKHQCDGLNSSYMYIRRLCITLLRLLLNAFPDVDETYFKQMADKFYALRQFSDMCKFIEEFSDKTISQMKERTGSSRYAIDLVKEYVNAHYNEELDLERLADKVFLSPKYLSTIFIQMTGIGLNKYIKKVRMEKARELLLTTNMKIIDICQSVGYCNESYFCKTFQETFGLTPDKYRQNRVIC